MPAPRTVVLEDLYRILANADKIVVTANPKSWLGDIWTKTLFRSTDKRDLEALRNSLELEPPKELFHCMCDGGPVVSIYARDKERVELTNHHGLSIRCSLWDSDVRITNTEKWLTWFDERGMLGPRQEVEAMRAAGEQNQKDYEKWLNAMPNAVRPVWPEARGRRFGEIKLAPLRAAFEREISNDRERILALLEWFGSGAGPWSGHPSYEQVAEVLLLGFATKTIIAAVESTGLSPAQTEGAARLFAGWQFGKQRPEDLIHLPDALKVTLWHHSQNTQDQDKYGRARRAFAK